MNQTKIEIRDPADLRLHPLQKKYVPEPDKDSAEWHAFVDAQSAAGPDGIPEIFITHDGQIMEGGRRWRAARQLQWPEIRAHVRPDEDCAALIVESLLGQRNLMRGTKVYLALTLLEEFVESTEHRRLEHLKKGVKTLEKPLKGVSPSELAKPNGRPSKPDSIRSLAERFGCSDELVRQAIDLRSKLDADPDLKAFWEPKLFTLQNGKDSPVSIGAALAGIGGAGTDQTDHEGKKAYTQMSLALERIGENAEVWNDEKKRDQIIEEWQKAASKIPRQIRKAIIEVLQNA